MSVIRVKIKHIIYFILILVIAWFGIDVAYHLKPQHHEAPIGVWAHRGLHVDFPQNSLASYNAALEKGFEGIELDVFYIEALDRFIVAHDFPASDRLDTLLTLEEVFLEFEDKLYYWMDLKNLNKQTYPKIHKRLDKLSGIYPIKDKLYIESASAVPLGKLAKSDFHTLYWAQYHRTPPKRWLKIKLIKIYFTWYSYAGVSCQHDYCTNDFIKLFNKKNLFIFTINSMEEYKRLMPYMKIFLTDLTKDNFL